MLIFVWMVKKYSSSMSTEHRLLTGFLFLEGIYYFIRLYNPVG